MSNLDRFKTDLDKLLKAGQSLDWALQYLAAPSVFEKQAQVAHDNDSGKAAKFLKGLPNFRNDYQAWYSEALVLVKQLLPDRVADFVRLYDRPKSRKDISYENYTIEDALQGLQVTRSYSGEKVVGADAAIAKLQQQLAIVAGAKARFESSLFDLRALVQADLFDSDLDAASHLLKNKFGRAAGALAGVVIEKHLGEVASRHNVVVKKKDPTIADLNEALKAESVIDIPTWRFVQHLADIRNLCDHNKSQEPTKEQVQDLLDGTAKIIKTVF